MFIFCNIDGAILIMNFWLCGNSYIALVNGLFANVTLLTGRFNSEVLNIANDWQSL